LNDLQFHQRYSKYDYLLISIATLWPIGVILPLYFLSEGIYEIILLLILISIIIGTMIMGINTLLPEIMISKDTIIFQNRFLSKKFRLVNYQYFIYNNSRFIFPKKPLPSKRYTFNRIDDITEEDLNNISKKISMKIYEYVNFYVFTNVLEKSEIPQCVNPLK
jgi:hypothetical protein